MKAEYDNIAEAYANTQDERIAKKYIYKPSLLKAIGNIEDKKIIDLGCGDGFFTREIKLLGASEVVGVDLSPEMIKLANEKEKENPLGIRYEVGDISKLNKLGEFDMAVGGFILHYSKTKEELLGMCKSIYSNLKSGAKIVALNNNPDHPETKAHQYNEVSVKAEGGELMEGSKMKVTLIIGGKEICSFYNYFWSKETYEQCFKEAGFKDIKWLPLSVSDEGVKKYGREFWNEWYENPYLVIIEATK
ncbi:MAG: methyltransferase domain-containing protein [Candidatus Paceibacterota bacterium]